MSCLEDAMQTLKEAYESGEEGSGFVEKSGECIELSTCQGGPTAATASPSKASRACYHAAETADDCIQKLSYCILETDVDPRENSLINSDGEEDEEEEEAKSRRSSVSTRSLGFQFWTNYMDGQQQQRGTTNNHHQAASPLSIDSSRQRSLLVGEQYVTTMPSTSGSTVFSTESNARGAPQNLVSDADNQNELNESVEVLPDDFNALQLQQQKSEQKGEDCISDASSSTCTSLSLTSWKKRTDAVLTSVPSGDSSDIFATLSATTGGSVSTITSGRFLSRANSFKIGAATFMSSPSVSDCSSRSTGAPAPISTRSSGSSIQTSKTPSTCSTGPKPPDSTRSNRSSIGTTYLDSIRRSRSNKQLTIEGPWPSDEAATGSGSTESTEPKSTRSSGSSILTSPSCSIFSTDSSRAPNSTRSSSSIILSSHSASDNIVKRSKSETITETGSIFSTDSSEAPNSTRSSSSSIPSSHSVSEIVGKRSNKSETITETHASSYSEPAQEDPVAQTLEKERKPGPIVYEIELLSKSEALCELNKVETFAYDVIKPSKTFDYDVIKPSMSDCTVVTHASSYSSSMEPVRVFTALQTRRQTIETEDILKPNKSEVSSSLTPTSSSSETVLVFTAEETRPIDDVIKLSKSEITAVTHASSWSSLSEPVKLDNAEQSVARGPKAVVAIEPSAESKTVTQDLSHTEPVRRVTGEQSRCQTITESGPVIDTVKPSTPEVTSVTQASLSSESVHQAKDGPNDDNTNKSEATQASALSKSGRVVQSEESETRVPDADPFEWAYEIWRRKGLMATARGPTQRRFAGPSVQPKQHIASSSSGQVNTQEVTTSEYVNHLDLYGRPKTNTTRSKQHARRMSLPATAGDHKVFSSILQKWREKSDVNQDDELLFPARVPPVVERGRNSVRQQIIFQSETSDTSKATLLVESSGYGKRSQSTAQTELGAKEPTSVVSTPLTVQPELTTPIVVALPNIQDVTDESSARRTTGPKHQTEFLNETIAWKNTPKIRNSMTSILDDDVTVSNQPGKIKRPVSQASKLKAAMANARESMDGSLNRSQDSLFVPPQAQKNQRHNNKKKTLPKSNSNYKSAVQALLEGVENNDIEVLKSFSLGDQDGHDDLSPAPSDERIHTIKTRTPTASPMRTATTSMSNTTSDNNVPASATKKDPENPAYPMQEEFRERAQVLQRQEAYEEEYEQLQPVSQVSHYRHNNSVLESSPERRDPEPSVHRSDRNDYGEYRDRAVPQRQRRDPEQSVRSEWNVYGDRVLQRQEGQDEADEDAPPIVSRGLKYHHSTTPVTVLSEQQRVPTSQYTRYGSIMEESYELHLPTTTDEAENDKMLNDDVPSFAAKIQGSKHSSQQQLDESDWMTLLQDNEDEDDYYEQNGRRSGTKSIKSREEAFTARPWRRDVVLHQVDSYDISVVTEATSGLKERGKQQQHRVCQCADSVFSGNDEFVEFYLPLMGMACTCGARVTTLRNPEEPSSLENVLRTWQVEFLAAFGIYRGDQLVKAHHRSAAALSNAMRKYRKKMNLTPFPAKSCAMALAIWSKTSKSFVRSIRKQLTSGITGELKIPNTLYILSSFLEKISNEQEGSVSSPPGATLACTSTTTTSSSSYHHHYQQAHK